MYLVSNDHVPLFRMSGEAVQSVLYYNEAESFVESLQKFQIKAIGSDKWELQRAHVEKLNIQAVVDATNLVEESIKELLLTHDKIPTLIHEIVALDLWKRNVLPVIFDMTFNAETSFPAYVVMFYEATLVGLLEVLLYHSECCEAAGDTLHDLLQYCQGKLVWLIAGEEDWHAISTETTDITDPKEELRKRHKKISFNVALKCVAIVRYIGEHSKDVSLGITTRVLNTYDFPAIFAGLIDSPPWVFRQDDGQWLKYDNNKWNPASHEEVKNVSKLEGQLWIGMLQFLMSEHCQPNYQLNSSNQAAILKIRAHFHPRVLDALPALLDLQRYLEELSLISTPSSKPPLILEQVPQFYTDLETKCRGKWADLAKKHYTDIFCMSKERLKKQADTFAATYDMDVMSELLSEPPKCESCGEAAAKRCSSCQSSWYCGRECQVKHWTKHKDTCKVLSQTVKDAKKGG